MTTSILNGKILFGIVNIANKYGVHVGQNIQTGQIEAENFKNAGELVHFKNEAEEFLDKQGLERFHLTTHYNPYELIIGWS